MQSYSTPKRFHWTPVTWGFLLFSLLGLAVPYGPQDMAWWHSNPALKAALIVWQIIIGIALFWSAQWFNSFYESRMHWQDKRRNLLEIVWLIETILGALVITNIARYGEVLSWTGPWILWVIGLSICGMGAVLFFGSLFNIPPAKR